MLYTLAALVLVVCFTVGVIVAGSTQSDELNFAWGAVQVLLWLGGVLVAALLISAARPTRAHPPPSGPG